MKVYRKKNPLAVKPVEVKSEAAVEQPIEVTMEHGGICDTSEPKACCGEAPAKPTKSKGKKKD
jgi:hypothetical protein